MTKRVNGEGTIIQRHDGRFAGAVRYTAPDGTSGRRWFYGRTKTDVRTKMAEFRRRLDANEPVSDSALKMADYVSEWIGGTLAAADLSPSTVSTYDSLLRNHVIPFLGHKRLSDIRPQHIEQFIGRLRKQGLSPSTIRHAFIALNKVLATAVRDGLLRANPADHVPRPRVPHKEARHFSQNDVAQLLAASDGHRLQPLLKLALATGLRRGELCGLRWESIDLDHATLVVTATSSGSVTIFSSEPRRPTRVIG